MRYYGLIAGLPTPRVGQPLPLAIPELRAQVEQYVEGADRDWVHTFFYRIDWHNAASMLASGTLQERPSASSLAQGVGLDAGLEALWLKGGNLDAQEVERWLRLGPDTDSPFHNPDRTENADPGERLNDWWQRYHELLLQHPDRNLKRLVAYDATLRNFQGGHLYRSLSSQRKSTEGTSDTGVSERPFRYLPGGWFDRFAYLQGQVGDVRAEHPYTAGVLAHFDNTDPVERQTAMQEARLAFYEHVAFFEPFAIGGLAARLYAYTDRQLLDLQDAALGAKRLDAALDAWLARYGEAAATPARPR